MKRTILAVDDTPENLDLLRETFSEEFRVKVATDGERALALAQSGDAPDIILLDVMMPGMDGFEVCRKLKADPRTARIPVIFITALASEREELLGLDLGAVDYLHKPINPALAKIRVRNQINLYDRRRELEYAVKERTIELEQARKQIILRLGRAAEFKDNETGNHILRMSQFAQVIALEAGIDEGLSELIANASPMHDIGKIGIPDRILLKPSKLDDEEWVIMRTHPTVGSRILGHHSDPLLLAAYEIALTHHEKWDGSGYPNKLKGDEIPLFGRIAAIADVFDALTSVRPYKAAWPIEQAVAQIVKDSGSHFDPDLVKAFMHSWQRMAPIKDRFADEIAG